MSALGPITACLLGGAVGDAIGEPIEFLSLAQIRERFGPDGVRGPVDPAALRASDDTQMTLFTAEGIARAMRAGIVDPAEPRVLQSIHDAYQRWLRTQGEQSELVADRALARRVFGVRPNGLLARAELHARREPGNTCIGGLRAARPGSARQPLNDSPGCGGVMRVAPVGLAFDRGAFELGCASAALTHGNANAIVPSGLLAVVVGRMARGASLDRALDDALDAARVHHGHGPTARLVEHARRLARFGSPTPELVESLGGGWHGHDALAIGVYCALATGSWTDAVLLAANHGGDCDSTASIAGSLAGLAHGVDAIPVEWIDALDLREAVLTTARELASAAA